MTRWAVVMTCVPGSAATARASNRASCAGTAGEPAGGRYVHRPVYRNCLCADAATGRINRVDD